MVRKVLTIGGLALLLLALLVYSGVADPILNPLRDYVVKTAVKLASKSLNGSLEVGAVQGSLFRAPVLQNIVLRDSQGAVIGHIDELRLAYRLISLIKGRLPVEVDIVRPQLTVVQEPDGRLNFSHVLPQPERPAEPKKPAAGFGLPITVVVEHVQIQDGHIALRLPSLPGVQDVEGLQMRLSAQLNRQGLRAQLQQLVAHTAPADVDLKTLQGTFQALSGVTQIDDLRLQMGHTVLTAAGILPGSPQPASFGLQVQPLDLTEIGRLVGNDALQDQLHVTLTAEGPPEALVVHSQLNAARGKVELQGEVNTVATPQRYRGALDITHFDLTALLQRATLQSDVNVHLRVTGEGLSARDLRSELQLEIEPSHLGNVVLHPSQIHVEAHQQRFQVQRFDLDTSVARMTASGALDLAGTSDLQYELAANLADLRQLMGTEALDGDLHMQGQATGEWPALHLQGVLEAHRLRYQDNRLRSLQLDYEGSQLGSQPLLSAKLQLRQAQAGAFPVEQVTLDMTYRTAERQMRFTTEVVQSPGHDGRVNGAVTLGDAGQQVVLDDVVLHLPDRTWQAPEPVQVVRENQHLQFTQLRLVHADEAIEVSGAVDGDRLQDIRLRVAQLDLTYLRRLMALPDAVGGRATLQVQLAGTLAAPLLQADLALQSKTPQDLPFEGLHTTLTYEQRQLQSAMRIQQASREVLALDLRLPIDMAFTAVPLEQRLLDAPMEVHVQLERPDLMAFRRVQPTLPKITGTLQGALDLQGTYAASTVAADIQLEQLSMEGTAEQVTGPVHLTAKMLNAASAQELVHDLSQRQLAPQLQELVLRVPTLHGQVPGRGTPPQPFNVQDLLLQAEGQWSPQGLQGTLQTLHVQATAFGLPRTDLTMAAHWTPQQMELTQLRVRMPQSELQGQGHLTMPGQQLQFRLDIPRLQLDEFPITLPPNLPATMQGTVKVAGTLQAPQVAARLRYAGAQILADLGAQLQERLPRYQATLRVEGLEMANVLPAAQGRLQAQLQLQGAGFTPEQRRASLDLSVDTDQFTLAPGLTVRMQANLAGEAMRLDNLSVRSTPMTLTANGSLSATRQAALTYNVTLGDLSPLQKLLGAELQASGSLSGEVRGALDALQARGALQLDKWRYAALHGQRLQADFSAAQLPAAPRATIKMQLAGVEGPSLPASALRLEANYAAPQGTFTVAVTEGPYQKTMLTGNAILADGQRLTLDRLHLQHPNLAWDNDGPIEVVRSPQGALQVRRLLLRSGSQRISVQASLVPEGPVKADVQVQRLQIGQTMQVAAPNMAALEGQLSLDLTVGGTLRQPQAQGKLQLTSLAWQKRDLGEMRGTIDLANATLRPDFRWQYQQRELFQLSGTLGLSPDGAIALRMRAPDLDLKLLPALTPAIKDSAGTLRLDLQLAGTLQQPQARGRLELNNGALQLAATGERYKDIQARLIFAGNRLDIERLYVGSRSGPLQLMGRIETAGATLQQVNLSVQAKEFTAMHTPMMEAVISTDLNVRGSLQDMTATGTVTVPRARVAMEGIPGTEKKAVQPWELTVQGVYGPGPKAASASDGAAPGLPGQEAPLPFLRADVKIDLPRNVWVQAPGTAVEMSGAIRVTKEREQPFILSGLIETVRGYASFYGKKFVLQTGQITFTGSPEINPVLNVTVTQQVTDYVVTVHVEGKARQPQIQFSSTPDLPQADILSLLILGKTTDKLTSSESNALSSQAQQLVGNVIAGKLEETIGKSLGLDTIGITAGDRLGSAGISVGRYLTQDLFMSYEHELSGGAGASSGAGANKSTGGDKVGVEYSINRSLKLKASSSDRGESAIDFLWRKDY
jgi:autotransporter translocation and assembly factor TamB